MKKQRGKAAPVSVAALDDSAIAPGMFVPIRVEEELQRVPFLLMRVTAGENGDG